jgi:tripartite-type tricarboxylate transporter receptor subunit TctC
MNATRRRVTLAAALGLGGLGSPWARADAWPNKPIHLVVPFPPGGATDLFGRLAGAEMANSLGQAVVIDNRPGAGGNIGTREVVAATPDGYTLLLGTVGTNAINPTLYGNLPYDTRKALVAVASLGSSPNVLVVNPKLPVKSVAELTALAKSRPGKLNMGSSGNGSSIHMCGELYKYLAHVDIVHVPYRGGGPAMTDLLGGQIDLMFDNFATSAPHIANGSLRALAVTSAKRSPALPDVPTMMEAGVPGYEATPWSAVFAPAGTDMAVVQRLHDEIVKALLVPKVQARYRDFGTEAPPQTQAEFTAFVAKEYVKWSEVVKVSGARAD